MDTRIRRFVHRVRNRLREQQIVSKLIDFSGYGMAIAVLISLIALCIPFYYAVLVATGVVILFFLSGMVCGIRKTPKPMEAALRVDAKGYQEKITTALYLNGKEDAFSVLQKKDAMQIIDTFQIKKEFPIRLQWKRVSVLLLLTVVFVVSSMIDTPAKQVASIRHDVNKEAEDRIAQLEKVEKEIAKNKEIPENEAAEIMEQLENAKQELKEAQSYGELTKAEERITKKMEMASENVQNKTLGDIMQEAAQEGTEAAEQKEKELAKEAQQALEKAAGGSDEEKEEAYEKLKKLAETTGNSNLSQMAENYKASGYSDSEYASVSKALAEAIQNTQMSNTDLASNNQSANNNTSNNTNSSSPNASNTVKNGSGNHSNNSQNTNQGNNGNRNQNNGNSVKGNSNQSGTGGGSGNGAGNGPGWNYGGKNGSEGSRKTNENVTVPDGEVGDDENLTGKANGNDSSTKEKSNQSRTWSGNKVNYDDVSGEYKEKAYSKINGSNYPGKMKDKIRNYFDGLN